MAEDRQAKIAALFQNVNKKYGKDTMVLAKDLKMHTAGRVSTGILALDYSLGGGLPTGRISMFYGHKSSGKTTTLLRTCGRAQKSCSNCWHPYSIKEGKNGPKRVCTNEACGDYREAKIAWFDVEGAWDKAWSEKFVDLDEMLFIQPEYGEQTVDVADSLLRSGAIDIIVIDSIAFMTPHGEIENSAEKASVGVQARMIGNAMRKFVSTLNEMGRSEGRRPTVWLTNQIRMKVGVMFGNPETVSGGLAAGFATSCEVRFSPGKASIDDETGKPISQEFKFKVEKNKLGPPKMEGEFTQVMSNTEVKKPGDIMDEAYAVTMADKIGVIEIGRGRCVYNGAEFDGGRSVLEKHLMLNPLEYEELKLKVLPVLLAI